MNNTLLRIVAIIAVVIAGIFGFFLYKSHGDFVLAKSMLVYEVNSLISDSKGRANIDTQDEAGAAAEDEAVQTSEQTTATNSGSSTSPDKDTIYQGNGNSFSDYKKQGGDEVVTLK